MKRNLTVALLLVVLVTLWIAPVFGYQQTTTSVTQSLSLKTKLLYGEFPIATDNPGQLHISTWLPDKNITIQGYAIELTMGFDKPPDYDVVILKTGVVDTQAILSLQTYGANDGIFGMVTYRGHSFSQGGVIDTALDFRQREALMFPAGMGIQVSAGQTVYFHFWERCSAIVSGNLLAGGHAIIYYTEG